MQVQVQVQGLALVLVQVQVQALVVVVVAVVAVGVCAVALRAVRVAEGCRPAWAARVPLGEAGPAAWVGQGAGHLVAVVKA